MKKWVLIICLVALLTQGCTGDMVPFGYRVIGPYVTDVTLDDTGNVVVTREQIKIFAPEHVFIRTAVEED